jgi:hypothetical protein
MNGKKIAEEEFEEKRRNTKQEEEEVEWKRERYNKK